jgi:predicted  nucleic acid-binding Zn-ribbon protein
LNDELTAKDRRLEKLQRENGILTDRITTANKRNEELQPKFKAQESSISDLESKLQQSKTEFKVRLSTWKHTSERSIGGTKSLSRHEYKFEN